MKMVRLFSVAMFLSFLASGMARAQYGPGSAANDPTKVLGMPGDSEDFVKRGLQNSMATVEFSRFAAEKGSTDGVKGFAKQAMDDHTQITHDLMQLSASLGQKAPDSMDSKQKKIAAKLQGLSGADFDKAYLDEVQKLQHDEISAFRAQTSNDKVPAVKQVAQQDLPLLERTSSSAKQLSKQMGGK